jgi:nuclear exosome regulator NRDE2
VLTHWEGVLKKYNSPELIVEYLNFRQTSFFTFTYPEMLDVYSQCLAKLRKLAWMAKPSERRDIERRILYVFQRLSHLAREAGYDELSTALFQALLELNLFRPNSFLPTSEREREEELNKFEEFWDSECPRFGEDNAHGWRSFDPDASVVEVPPVTDVVVVGNDIDSWYEREERNVGHMPARTTDELSQDDPYRVILFNDVRPFLYTFTTDVIREIPYALLSYFGARLLGPDFTSNDSRLTDSWLYNKFNSDGFWPRITDENTIEWIHGEAVEPDRTPGITDPFGFKRKAYPVSLDSLFPPEDEWFHHLDSKDFFNPQFLSTGLRQLKPVIEDEWFMIFHLAIEHIYFPDTVLKHAKSYLRARKTSTSLWNVYALLLWRRGEFDEARKVWKTAIEMTSSTRSDPAVLWHTWIAAEFERDRISARILLSQLSSDKPTFVAAEIVGGAGEMKTRRHLQTQFDRVVSFKAYTGIEVYAFLSVLLEYLSSNLESAIRKCKQVLEVLHSKELTGTVTHERILLSISKILYWHTKHEGWYRASTLRDFWFDAISTFPNNTAFLSLFTWNEANARIDGRVRKLLASMEKTSTVDVWIFNVWAEISLERGHVSEFGIRSIFEKALESDANRSVVLWLLYIDFEVRFGKALRAKELVFRAIRQCPWAKGITLCPGG